MEVTNKTEMQMNTEKVMELIADGAMIEGTGNCSFLIHSSFRKGKRKLTSMIYWAVWSKCEKEKITFPESV
jgi:hypothetical protein